MKKPPDEIESSAALSRSFAKTQGEVYPMPELTTERGYDVGTPEKCRATTAEQLLDIHAQIALMQKHLAETTERLNSQAKRLEWLENEVGR
jgi:hypothetical protein